MDRAIVSCIILIKFIVITSYIFIIIVKHVAVINKFSFVFEYNGILTELLMILEHEVSQSRQGKGHGVTLFS